MVRGLSEAQKHGIFHGDIRPATIYLTADMEFKLGNFGKP